MPAYEGEGFSPAAPVVRARVVAPDGTSCSDVPLLIDTGADVSVIPMHFARTVGVEGRPSDTSVQFYEGEATTYLEADLRIELLHFRIRARFLLSESSYGILGRNILNLFVVTLDGPRLSWSV